jgi:hypothetical protein
MPEVIPRIEPLGIRPRFPRIPAYLKSYGCGFDAAEQQRKLDNLARFAAEGEGFAIGENPFFPGESIKFGYSTAFLEVIGLYWSARWRAVQAALKGSPDWQREWQRSAAYGYWGYRMEFQKKVGPWLAQNMLYVVADCLVLGWEAEAIDLAQRVYRALDRDFFSDYSDRWHPRTQFFVLRLIADWQGWPPPNWQKWVLDEPLFNALLEHWRAPDASALLPLLLAACDRHTHESRSGGSGSSSYDIDKEDYWYDPFEVLTLMKLRQLQGLENPVLKHLLMNTPLGKLPEPAPPYSDPLLEGVIARVRSIHPDL